MIEELVTYVFERIGHLWNISGKLTAPEPEDVTAMLDEIAGVLYDSDEGAQFQTGGLIVEKTDGAYDVYVYVGTYN